MRRLSPVLLLLATACAGGFAPVRIRPGSNMALPSEGSLVGAIVNGFICDKSKRSKQASSETCGLVRPDTLAPVPNTPPAAPPAKRP